MSRAHCLDCGTDVPVDPLGHCPEGHLLPAHGRRVESAIGSDDHHPDEPEPWIAEVAPPAETGPDELVSSAEPQAAPGLGPAERETSTGDLLRELGSLSAPDDAGPSPAPGDAGPTSGPSATAAPGHEPPAPPSPQPPPSASAGPDPVSEHSALEQALQSLDDDHQVPAAPVATDPTGPAPAIDADLSSLFDELEGLDDDTRPSGSTPAAPAPAPTDAPAAAPSSPPPSAPPPTAAPSPPPTPPPPDEHAGNGHEGNGHEGNGHAADGATRGLDTMNFTAKGGAMNGRRRRRLLGR